MAWASSQVISNYITHYIAIQLLVIHIRPTTPLSQCRSPTDFVYRRVCINVLTAEIPVRQRSRVELGSHESESIHSLHEVSRELYAADAKRKFHTITFLPSNLRFDSVSSQMIEVNRFLAFCRFEAKTAKKG